MLDKMKDKDKNDKDSRTRDPYHDSLYCFRASWSMLMKKKK